MPPFLPRKRLRSSSPEAGPSEPTPKRPKASTRVKGRGKGTEREKATVKQAIHTPRKKTLFDDLDAGIRSGGNTSNKKSLPDIDDDGSSLSSLSDTDDFEDVPIKVTKRQNLSDDDSEEDDEEIEFEDVNTNAPPAPAPIGPAPSGDLELTLIRDNRVSLTNPFGNKKGPSKIERGIRTATHQIHVQALMWHNHTRNHWLCDKEVQDILVKALPKSVMNEVESWRRNSGLPLGEEEGPTSSSKGKGKGKTVNGRAENPRSQRDWGRPAERSEKGEANRSRGDPLHKLLKNLRIYWKQRFRITAPGLRKVGYMSLEKLDGELKSFNNDPHDPELHGEKIANLDEFKEHAQKMEGSRDVGAQLFTGLLRAIGIEARMVANLQPLGFGWSQHEEAFERNPRKLKKKSPVTMAEDTSDDENDTEGREPTPKPIKKPKPRAITKTKTLTKSAAKDSTRRASRGNGREDAPVELTDSDEEAAAASDSDSVIDVTPAKQRVLPSLPYDKDLLFPHYWTEALSPVTNMYTPVDAVVLHIVANEPKFLEMFEPRGGKSDKAKQVTSYIIGHSPDGSAKDVTTRYLKRHMWPGRTKGNRLGVEKVPIYNRNGKVKRYEEFDWFKTVMSAYSRGTRKFPRTEIDDHEEATDLKAVKPEKKEVVEGKETLQSYKTSTEFVLERHFKREEALRPGAEHVKTFTIKGKGEESVEEKVYLRKDVVSCKSQETWHKEGRAPILGEEPLKRVPYRVATTNRRRELAEAEHASGEKPLQGLYSWDQTDWIIPPPIENGVIPKNNFGNIDLYVDSMLPEGAAHIPRRGTVKICKRLGIDYAEAVTGFEFGHRMAVPIINGVVIAEEHCDAVMEEWEKEEIERVRKEDEKRTKTALTTWKKFLMGMRIIERVREEYGDELDNNPDVLNPYISKKAQNTDRQLEVQARSMAKRDEEMAGGFLPAGHEYGEPYEHHGPSFFPIVNEDEDDQGGGFVVEEYDEPTKPSITQVYATTQALESSRTKKTFNADEDIEMEKAELAEVVPQAKKRGRPPKKAIQQTAKSVKGKMPAKRALPQKAPQLKINGKSKRKAEVKDEEEEDEGQDSSSLLSDSESSSELEIESEPESEPEAIPQKTTRKAPRRRATLPAQPKKTPRRTATKNEELRSRYFDHDDLDNDDG